MPITMQVKSEQGELVYEGGVFEQTNPTLLANKYPLFASIDPYGTTVFNSGQAARLVDEASSLAAEPMMTEAGREAVVRVAGICATYLRRPKHRLLWFLGD